ncbi:MAG: restriction endonuclease subunit S, partial [ANME-2 cluster archaeon]
MIPDGWQVQNLADVALIILGQSPPSSACNDKVKGYPFYQGNADFGYRHPLPQNWIEKPLKVAKKDDILISVRAPVGELNIANTDCCIGRGVGAIRPLSVNRNFIYYTLLNARNSLASVSQGSTFDAINGKELRSLSLLIPPFPEQKKIAAILSSVDDAIQATQAVIDQTRTVKQGLLQQLLTRGIGHTRFKQTEIGEIPEEWDLTSLANLGPPDRPAIKAGPFGSALKKSFYVNHGYKVYGQEQVISGDFSIGNYYIDANLFEKLKTCAVHPGDILISLVGTFGKSVVAPHNIEPGIINPRLVRLALEPSLVEPFFIKEWLGCSDTQKQLKGVAHGGTMGILNAGTFKSLQLPLTPLHEQRHIVNILSSFDETLKAEHAKLQQNFRIKKGLMQDLLTGRVRVKL